MSHGRVIRGLLRVLSIAILAGAKAQTKPGPQASPGVKALLTVGFSPALSWRARFSKFEQALNEAIRVNDRVGEGLAIFWEGRCLFELGQPTKALDCFEKALPIRREVGDRAGEANTLNNIGSVYDRLGQKLRALNYFAQALPIKKEVGDRGGEAAILNSVGSVYQGLGQEQRALDYYDQALGIRREVGDRRGEAITLSNIGMLESGRGRKQVARNYFEQALAISKQIGDRRSEASTLTNIGLVCRDLGQHEAALGYYMTALPIMKGEGDSNGLAKTLNNIGSVDRELGQEARALVFYGQALSVLKLASDPGAEAVTLNNVGSVYSDLGQQSEALSYFKKSLRLLQQVGDRRGEAAGLNNIGTVYDDLGQRRIALAYYQKALTLRKLVGDRRGEATSLNNIGLAYGELRELQKALEYYGKTLSMREEVGDRSGEATTLNNIGAAYHDLGQAKRALEPYERALALRRQVGDRSGEAVTLQNIAVVYSALGDPASAIALGKQAVNVTQTLRADIKGLSRKSQHAYRDLVSSRYRDLADWLAGVGRLAEAQQVLELLKDQEFFGFLRRRAGTKAEAVDLSSRESAWTKKYDELGDGIAALGAEHDELARIPVSDRTTEQAKRLVELGTMEDAAAEAFHSFLTQINEAFSAVGAGGDSRVKDLSDSTRALQRALHDLPGAAALYTLVTGDGVRVIVTVPGLNAPRKAPKLKVGATELGKKVLAFRVALTDPSLDPRPLGAELYDLLVRPIEKDLKAARTRTLMWSLDGVLRYIPMWALYDRATKQYLIEKYPSSLFTPHTVDRLRERPRPWVGAEFGVSKGGNVDGVKFGALPGVRDELAGVHKSLSGPAPVLDSAFTLKALRAALDTQPTVIHLATHFRFKSGDDSGSFLLLGNDERLSVEDLNVMADGVLSGVDLLVLSACETAMSGDGDGSEFEGFALLAQLKGAGAVMASLWPVADESTSLLMGDFYRLRKAHPEWTKLEALRQAQLRMLRGEIRGRGGAARTGMANVTRANPQVPKWPAGLPRFAHPYYWAPFVLTGNWR
jgi:CHAT domain-containing protein/Tfp pilus assembly protein PilF